MQGYSRPAKYLHWAVAGLIVVQFVLAELAESAAALDKTLQQLALTANHKSVGMTVLILALTRLFWRVTHPAPSLPAGVPQWQRRAAQSTHWLMYGLLIAIPISGWMMSSASAYSVSWFNLFAFPDLLAPDPELKEALEKVHEFLGKSLFVIAMGHIGAAFWHHFHDKDNVLRGMSSIASVGLGAAVLVAGVVFLRVGEVTSVAEPVVVDAEVEPADEPARVSRLPSWSIIAQESSIEFSAEQAGAVFNGRFDQWQARIQFDSDALNESSATVTVELASVATQDNERDETLATPEWFDGGVAVFRATGFERLSDSSFRTTNATLAFRGKPVGVLFVFSIEEQEDRVVLRGHTNLDRIALDVGTGEWADTTWVGQFVDVTVKVSATTSAVR